MAAAVDEFTIWLGNKLEALNTDENVFGSYITGILDSDEPIEDKAEAIEEILAEIIESDKSQICKEIIEMWQKLHPDESQTDAACSLEDVDTKLVRLLESQSLTATVQRQYTDDEKKIREAILAQYGQMTDEEDEIGEEPPDENGLKRNTNVQSVQQAEKEKRELAKLESQKKKDKDKEDREKQKQLKEEKKEKRKTQKGERRR